MAGQTEARIARWKKANRTRLQQYQRDYYRERKKARLEERLVAVRKAAQEAEGPRLRALELELKEVRLKLDRLRLQQGTEKGAA